jgi:hypothetical protein
MNLHAKIQLLAISNNKLNHWIIVDFSAKIRLISRCQGPQSSKSSECVLQFFKLNWVCIAILQTYIAVCIAILQTPISLHPSSSNSYVAY